MCEHPALGSHKPRQQDWTWRRKSEARTDPTKATRYQNSAQNSYPGNPKLSPHHHPTAKTGPELLNSFLL